MAGREKMKPILAVVSVAFVTVCAAPVAAQTQFDVSSLLNADVVINNGTGSLDATQSPVDEPAPNWAFLTQSAATELFPSDPDGLPDNGFFPATGIRPDVQLSWNNNNNGNNARTAVNATDTFSIDAPDANYGAVHLFATTGSGDSSVTITLNYATGPDTVANVTVPDWFDPPSGSLYSLIDGLDRAQATPPHTYEDSDNPAIFGIPVSADPNRVLQSIDVGRTDTSGVFNFFGAVGVAPVSTPAVSGDVPTLGQWALLAMIASLLAAAALRLR